MAWLNPCVVVLALTLNAIFGVGTSSSEASSVGMVKLRLYLPIIFTWSRPVFSSRESSTDSSLPALLSSLRSSLMLMHIFVGSWQTYSSKLVFGHSKSIMATREGSIARSLIPSGSILNVASSTSMEMAVVMSLKGLASDTLSLNISFFLSLCEYAVLLLRLKHYTEALAI